MLNFINEEVNSKKFKIRLLTIILLLITLVFLSLSNYLVFVKKELSKENKVFEKEFFSLEENKKETFTLGIIDESIFNREDITVSRYFMENNYLTLEIASDDLGKINEFKNNYFHSLRISEVIKKEGDIYFAKLEGDFS